MLDLWAAFGVFWAPVKAARRRIRDRVRPLADLTGGETRQLLVDVSVTLRQDAGTGIQRVVRAWLTQLLANPPEGFCVRPVFATRRNAYRYAPDGPIGAGLPKEAEAVVVRQGDVFFGMDLAAHIVPHRRRELLGWRLQGAALMFMVHDLLPLENPDWFNPKTVRNFKRWWSAVTRLGDVLICSSDAVAADVRRDSLFQAAGEWAPQVKVAPLGGDMAASKPSLGVTTAQEQLIRDLAERSCSVLVVGTIEPRKGHDAILDAFDVLWGGGCDAALVVVGRAGWRTVQLQQRMRTHAQNGRRLFWIDDASDECLTRLYGAARGVLFASRGEGYGLPLVEAMHHGLPLLVRDLPVFREIAGDQISYFQDDTPAALADRIQSWINGLSSTRIDDYRTLSWAESASILASVITDVSKRRLTAEQS